MKRILLSVLLALSVNAKAEGQVDSISVFSPTLVENNQGYCGAILAKLKSNYEAKLPLNERSLETVEKLLERRGYVPINFDHLSNERHAAGTPSVVDNYFIETPESKIYVRKIREFSGIYTDYSRRNYTYRFFLHEQPFVKYPVRLSGSREIDRASQAASFYKLLNDNKNSVTLVTYTEDTLSIFQSNNAFGWDTSCRFSIGISSLSEVPNHSEVKEQLRVFKMYGGSFIQRPGECSTPHSFDSRREERNKLAAKLMYEPWIYNLMPIDEKVRYVRKHFSGLERWSIYNLDDFALYKNYVRSLDKLKSLLAVYYFKYLNETEEEAVKLANGAVDIATSLYLQAFVGDYVDITDSDNFKLRKLILEHADLEDISKYTKPVAKQPPEGSMDEGYYEGESILSIALDYPEALEHLLKIGYNPNHKNRFGKTPLMYAAQRNQLEAVRLLIRYGASVHEATHKPRNFSCDFYRLGHTNVSVLHYAARYSSREIIDELLEEGANIFSKAYRNRKVKDVDALVNGDYSPMQWLQLLVDDSTVKWMKKEKNAEIFINNNLSIDDIQQIIQKYKRPKISSAQVSTGN